MSAAWNWVKKHALSLLAAAVVAAMIYSEFERARGVHLLPPGQPAPAFSLERYQGGSVQLASLRGKAVMMDFWATWCEPCAAEMPTLQKLAREYGPQGLEFVAANEDDAPGAAAAIAAFEAKVAPGLGPSVAYATGPFTAQYRVTLFPTLYLIDRQGRVADAMEGELPEFILRRRIESVLGR